MISITVMIRSSVTSYLLGLVLRTLTVVLVHAFGLCELVDLSAGEASNELLCKLVANGLAC